MQELFKLFEDFGKPYFRQGSMSDEDYQPEFFTFWNIDTPEDAFYDNEAKRYIELIQVGYYTNDATKIYSVMADFIESAKAAGFVNVGRAQDANSGRADYFGRVAVLKKINNIGG